MSGSLPSMVAVAPSDLARSSRDCWRSMAMISLAPRILAAMTALIPTEPVPKMATVFPDCTSSVLRMAPAPVWRPHPSGANKARLVSSFTLTRLDRWTMARLAKELWPKKLLYSSFLPWLPSRCNAAEPSGRLPPKFHGTQELQYAGCPDVHCSQVPQCANERSTLSPGFKSLISEPTCLMTPAPVHAIR